MPAPKDTPSSNEYILEDIANVCGVQLRDIEDIYPCTPLQVGIMAQPIERIYINCIYATLAPSIDAERFCHALRQVVLANPILRTRIVHCEFGLSQVVLNEIPGIARPSQSLEQVLDHEKSAPMHLGSPLFRAALVERNLVLTTHHAIADGGTYHRMFDNMSRAYHGQPLPLHADFKLFVKYCSSIDETIAKSFWASRFSGHPTVFPNVDPEHTSDASQRLKARIFFGPGGSNIPLGLMSSYIETAWVMTVASYTNAESVAFGRVLSGRLPALRGLESTWGPTIVTIPVQVNLKSNSTIGLVIKELAKERREALKSPALQYGLTRIRSVSEAARAASRFTTLLNFRTPTDDGRDYSNSDMEIHGEYEPHLPYGLCLSIVLDDTGLSVEVLYDEHVLCKLQTHRIIRQFEHILHLLLQSPAGTRLDQLQLLNPHDRREILEWNETIPEPYPQSLHDMFRDIVRDRPNDDALEGPDGHATYIQLDRMSDSIADELQRKGISMEDAIGLVFEKSIWAVVAQLAVLKAGAVCVPIDPEFPFARKETIVSASKAAMILTSAMQVDSLAGFPPSNIKVISAQSVTQSSIAIDQQPSRQDNSSQAAFILFTSGSTGIPKGHVLEHRNLVSSLKAIGRQMGWRPEMRMLQFAAFVWDMSIAEILGTLLFGGCICIPSEEARESYIADFIQSQKVDCAIFTPTVLRMIAPQEAPSLKTLMSIGEPVDLESARMWSGHARFFNAWGPSETACVSAMAESRPNSLYPESIGRPLASAIWIVDERNADKLMPIGGVGEMVVESSGVARGYLNDQDQTAASFISPPRWAPPRKRQPSAMPQRMYRTGDLARYNPDGSLEYIGRRDNQVKISGQRVELGEVEKVLSSCTAVRHAIAAIQTATSTESGHKALVAILSLKDPRLPTKTALKEFSAEFRPKIEEHLERIRETAASLLPSYMVPTIWRVVEDLPRTASLKIDRRSIKLWLAQWEPKRLGDLDKDALTPPMSEVERTLQITWSITLSVPEGEIGRESSFIRLGGDSILAISVATKCRKRGLRVSVATLLRSESLANVASTSELLPGHSSLLTDDLFNIAEGVSYVPLSPFQRLLSPNISEMMSQTSSFQCGFADQDVNMTVISVENALIKLVNHHEMLRARLVKHNGTWAQKVLSVPEAQVRLRTHSVKTQDFDEVHKTSMLEPFVSAQESLLVADLIFSQKNESLPLLLLTSHCLIDRSSWRIICKDVEALLMNPVSALPSSASFAQWVHAQVEQASRTTNSLEFPRADTEFWGLQKHTACIHPMVEHQLTVDADVAESILKDCNRPFNTKPAELLLATILLSFTKTFPDRGAPALYSQVDGREAVNNVSLNTSFTVGCFTTLVPVIADIGPERSVREAVVMVKDGYRPVLRDASSAFASHMIGPNPINQSDVEILVVFQELEEKPVGLNQFIAPVYPGLLKVFAERCDRRLKLRIFYDRCMAHQERLASWATNLEATLKDFASQLPCCEPRLTLSETPLLHMDYVVLRGLQTHLNTIGIDMSTVDKVLPCSPIQEGILFSQLKNSNHQYWMQITMKLTPTNSSEGVDVERVTAAWKAVCLAQPILRTILVSYEAKSAFQQVILKTVSPSMSDSTADPKQATVGSILDTLKPPVFNAAQPSHHLHLTRVSSSTVYATLHINHALFDERSVRLIGTQLVQAYTSATSLQRGHDLAEYLAWNAQHKEVALEYWAAHLSRLKPCLIPKLDFYESKIVEKGSDLCDVPIKDSRRLNSFCRHYGVTMANLLQVAWGIVLRQCTGAQSLSFGCLHSHLGFLEGADNTLGPLLAMAIYKFETASNTTLTELLRETNDDALRALEHAACSLGEIHEAINAGQSPLFDTIMTIYRLWPEDPVGTSEIRVEHLQLRGHNEYAVTLGIGYDDDSIVAKMLYDPSKISRSFVTEVAELFTTVVLKIVSNPEQSIEALETSINKPTSLFSAQDIARTVYRKAAAQCEIASSQIEDIHPCTPFQSQNIEWSIEGSNGTMDQYIFNVGRHMSSTRLQEIFNLIAATCAALRTRIVSLGEYGVCQVTLKTGPDWNYDDSLSEYLRWDEDSPVRYGRPLGRFSEVDEPGGKRYFVLSLHRTIYDSWTLGLVLQALKKACDGEPLPLLDSFTSFARRLSNRDADVSDNMLEAQTTQCHEAPQFPRIPPEAPSIKLSSSKSLSLRTTTEVDVLHAAWALCLSRLTGEDKVYFGVNVDGRKAPLENIARVAGPVGAIVPCAMDLSNSPTGESLLRITRELTNKWTQSLHTQITHGTHGTDYGKEPACSFRNVLIIDSGPAALWLPVLSDIELVQANRAKNSLGDARLVVRCRIMPNETRIEMQFDEQVISHEDVGVLLEQYKHAIAQLVSHAPVTLADLEPLSNYEFSLLQVWHNDTPISVDACIHDLVHMAAKEQPQAPAVFSWDYNINHGQLDDFSDRMATLLQREGVGAGTVVPYFLEKSMTAVVVMLGILKSGGTLLPLDIDHPAQRIATVLSDSCASQIVASSSLLARVRDKVNVPKIVAVDMELIISLPLGTPESSGVKSSNICYIIYTSGSTGKPKGVMITHSNLSTSVKYRRELVNMTRETRTLQYLNFIFDVSMFDIFLTLVSGGCVCMPSVQEWSDDIAGAIRRTRSNFAFLTPSLATLLDPLEVPTLRTLGLTGEPLEQYMVEQWRHIRVLNMYGPAEATVHSSGHDVSFGSGKHHLNIGRPSGCLYWIVDASDHNKLVPIGCPGELMIQGPIVSRGYLRAPNMTEAVFIDPPPWMRRFEILGVSQRCYKTGDLVVQTADGTVVYQGRKDTQVKLRGLRIELGEIENHLRRSSTSGWNLAVELIKPSSQNRDSCLAVFFAAGALEQPKTAEAPSKLLPPLAREAVMLRSTLTAALPTYMVPQFFVRLDRLPLTSSGKTDRASLRRIGATLSPRELGLYDPSNATSHNLTKPLLLAKQTMADEEDQNITGLEAELRQLWSQALDLPLDTIKASDSFFNIGGSSIRAMRLSHAARRLGIVLGVADVFKYPVLSEMTAVARHQWPAVTNTNFDRQMRSTRELASTNSFISACLAQIAKREQPYLVTDNIESIAEATDVQADMIAVGELDGEAWHNKFTIESPNGLSVSHLTSACETVIRHQRMFRTFFIQHGNTLYQVALKDVPLKDMVILEGATKDSVSSHTDMNTHLPRFHLNQLSDNRRLCYKLTLEIHHAHYDAISMDMVLQNLRRAYMGEMLWEGPSFHDWVSHVNSVPKSTSLAFWKEALEGSSMTYLVTPSVPVTESFCCDSIKFRVPLKNVITSHGTPSSVVQAAWALVLSRATGRKDVVFCCPNANRSLPSFSNIDEVCGPCLNFLPARALLQTQMTFGALIQQMQAKAIAAIPHQHQGFRSIIKKTTDWPSWTRYSSMLIYQNHESLRQSINFGDQDCVLTPHGKFGRCADILVEATPSSTRTGSYRSEEEGDLVIDILYSRRTFSEEQANWISSTFARVLENIPQCLEQPVDQAANRATETPYMGAVFLTQQSPPAEVAAGFSNNIRAFVKQGWDEVGLDVARHEDEEDNYSMFACGADLVTTMLLSRYYQRNGYHVSMQDLVNNPTWNGQLKLLDDFRTHTNS